MVAKYNCTCIVMVVMRMGADNSQGSPITWAVPRSVPAAFAAMTDAPGRGRQLGRIRKAFPLLDKHIHIGKVYLYVYVYPMVDKMKQKRYGENCTKNQKE